MEFEYKCPKCGKVEIFKSQKTVDRKSANNELCRNCKVREKQASEHYSRLCPECGKEFSVAYDVGDDPVWAESLKIMYNAVYCQECCDKRKAELKAEEERKRKA